MKIQLSAKDLDRFWSKTTWSGDCIIWTKLKRNEYGLFRYQGKIWSAHRFSFALENDLDPNLQVCHTCDNPPCVRGAHLFQGTAKVNSDDKLSKGRGSGILTNEQVNSLRQEPQTNTMVRDLSKKYGVSKSVIKMALTGETYSHLDSAINLPLQFKGWSLTPEQVAEILEELQSPYWGQQTALGQKYGVTKGTINHIARGRLNYTDTE